MPSSSHIESESEYSDSPSETSSVSEDTSSSSSEEEMSREELRKKRELQKKWKVMKKQYEALHYIWKRCKSNSKEKKKARQDMNFAKLKLKKVASKLYGGNSSTFL